MNLGYVALLGSVTKGGTQPFKFTVNHIGVKKIIKKGVTQGEVPMTSFIR